MDARQINEGSGIRPDLPEQGIEALQQKLRGEVIMPGASRYEHARKVWNGMIDRRPAMMVYCADANDVIETVRFAAAGRFRLDIAVLTETGSRISIDRV